MHCFSLDSLNCEFVRLCVSFRYAYFASQTSGLCSACTSVPFGILHACVFMFCVLRLAYTGFAQFFSPRPLLSLYACVCHIMLCALRLTNIGFVQCFSLGSLVSLYAYVSRFVMRTSPHKHRVCAVLAPRFRLEFCTRVFMFCVLCLTNIRFVQCLSLGPLFKFLRLSFSCYVMCTLPHKHQFRAVLSSRLIFKFTRLYWPRFVKTVKFVSAFLKKFETL